MTLPRFLQIHTLHNYSATLLNRDDAGLAKRLFTLPWLTVPPIGFVELSKLVLTNPPLASTQD